MKVVKSKNCDVNYLAKFINLTEFLPHPDPEVTKIKLAPVGGYKVVVGINSQPGMYVYFPVLSEINPDFLRYANLYRDATLNSDDSKSGFFEKNGKVTAIKLRGQVSEGFLIEFEIFNNWLVSSVNKTIEPNDGEEFDTIEDGSKSFWVNKKYVKPIQATSRTVGGTKTGRGKQPKGVDKLIEGQFRFHYDTVLLRKVPNVIEPMDLLSITEKIHGTSGISAHVLCNPEINKWQAALIWTTNNILQPISKLFGSVISSSVHPVYDYLYSSRSVIKNQFYNKDAGPGFYGCDVWAEADKYVRPKLIQGMTLYYEIVGFLPTGGYIQKGYDYGCVPPKEGEAYTPEVNFKVRIYRVTLTNPQGYVHEFSAKEVQQWCKDNGLIPVTEWYYGYAKDLYPDLDPSQHWNENFLERLANDKVRFFMEKTSPSCANKVPHEGIVLKTEKMRSEAWKLKCFAFLQGELNDEDGNIEDNA